MVGTILALVILGLVASYVGQAAEVTLGRYWRFFAGIFAIAMGLAALGLLPLQLPHEPTAGDIRARNLWSSPAFGLFVGGTVSAASLACNPGLFVVLGVAVLQGYTGWMLGVLVAYAVGFSLPLTAVVMGASLGKAIVRLQKVEAGLRVAAGVVLVGVGFYFLATF